jgi:hypothetical protein
MQRICFGIDKKNKQNKSIQTDRLIINFQELDLRSIQLHIEGILDAMSLTYSLIAFASTLIYKLKLTVLF